MVREQEVHWLKRIGVVLGLVVGLLVPVSAISETRVLGLRHFSAPTCTRLIVDLSQEVAFSEAGSSGQGALVVEFPGNLNQAGAISRKIKDGLVSEVILRRSQKGFVRLTVRKKDPGFKHVVFLLPRVDGHPVRLVVDVENPEAGRKVREERRTIQRGRGAKARVVVIDPGHGGEDPGAIGCRGTREKDVVLSIAKALQTKLSQSPETRAFLTRTGDYFVGLRQRVEIAKEYGADLFLSIHADSSPNRTTRGASVYCLSLTGATDEAARILAEKENSSDLIGGVRLSRDHDLNTILVDMVQTQTINESLQLGSALLSFLQPVQELKFPTPRQAGFRVLKAPDVPSVLIEVGFLSNPDEEVRLKDPSFQSRLAQGLERAVHRFLGQDPSPTSVTTAPQGTSVASNGDKAKGKASARRQHVVRSGQTLSAIASMYRTNVGDLRSLNGIQDPALIRPGQRILVP